jgi:hypothetical protein
MHWWWSRIIEDEDEDNCHVELVVNSIHLSGCASLTSDTFTQYNTSISHN